jgi:nucleoside-diphosphate-sugar epimerase
MTSHASPPVVALTGATGFIGRRLTSLLQQRGWRVRALVRDATSGAGRSASLEQSGVSPVMGRLEDPASLARLVAGVDAVVHCAGSVRGVDLPDFERVNVDGLRRMVAAVRAADKPPRLLCLSSLAAREPGLSDYAASKRHGEELLASEAVGLEWVALRPPAVYGPGDKELLPLFRWMQRGLAPIVGDRSGRFSMLYVDDLAAAIETWLSKGHGVTGVFELDDGRDNGYSWDELVAIAAQRRSGRVFALPIPPGLLRSIAGINLAVARLAGYAPMLSPGKVRELRHHDWCCDNGPWQAVVSWRPEVQFAEGLDRTLKS